MELTVYWTQFAEDKLEDVFSYYIEKTSEKIALHLVNGIIDFAIGRSLTKYTDVTCIHRY